MNQPKRKYGGGRSPLYGDLGTKRIMLSVPAQKEKEVRAKFKTILKAYIPKKDKK